MTETLTALEGGHVLDLAPGATPASTTLRFDREDGKPGHRWWILAVLATAQLMVALDATVVSIALPHAQASLHFSSADRQWIVTAYALAYGSLGLFAAVYGCAHAAAKPGSAGWADPQTIGSIAAGIVLLPPS
jgi:MFS family permease